MNNQDYKAALDRITNWMQSYEARLDLTNVLPSTQPGDVYKLVNECAPNHGEEIDTILDDFEKFIVPNMTHWQHPMFFGYFPANASRPSILAEMLMSTIGAQCMLWLTSPAAAELEERMMEWLLDLLDLPQDWHGVIHDTASTSTFIALLTARERATNWKSNSDGLSSLPQMRIYASEHIHSSIDKAARYAGIGEANVTKIKTQADGGLDPLELAQRIRADKAAGILPIAVIAAFGTTGTGAIDPLDEIGRTCSAENVWLHVDAAYGGTAMMLPDIRSLAGHLTQADSYVFNPHKWMFVNFDCSAFFVKDKESLLKTFALTPEYLKTQLEGEVNDYSNWGIALGRRFRALKLWFVMRSFGKSGLRDKLHLHISLAKWIEKHVKQHPNLEIFTQVDFGLVCFFVSDASLSMEQENSLTKSVLENLNASKQIFLTHSKQDGRFFIRMSIGATNVTKQHVETAWEMIRAEVATVLA